MYLSIYLSIYIEYVLKFFLYFPIIYLHFCFLAAHHVTTSMLIEFCSLCLVNSLVFACFLGFLFRQSEIFLTRSLVIPRLVIIHLSHLSQVKQSQGIALSQGSTSSVRYYKS